MKEPLTETELEALKTIGVIAENWYAVTYDENQIPFAIFSSHENAKTYRDRFIATAIIEPWPMILKDMRKANLKRLANGNNLPSMGEVSDAIEMLAKKSTAPDAETPNWLKADIRNGINWALNYVTKKNRS